MDDTLYLFLGILVIYIFQSQINFNKNLIKTQEALNLSQEEVKTLLINSFKSSFLNEEKKKQWISKI